MVGEGAGDGLGHPPHQLANSQGETQGGDTQASVCINRGNEQSEGLAGAHRDHQQTGSSQGDGEALWRIEGAEHQLKS